MKHFILFNQEYELVALAMDQSKESLGKIAVYRVPGTQKYFTMPVSELSAYVKRENLPLQSKIDWKSRIELYKERFVGRTDVYANRYFNKKQNKKVYSPAVPFMNGMPMRNHFLPLTDDVIERHLQSKANLAIGLYPINGDNKTKFLAFDIDGHREDQPWKELTESLLQVCHSYNLQPLVELSQSGIGCHVWLFFEDTIESRIARQLGDVLLKVTQKIDSRLPFSAFDRLFPAQNQIEKGKIGNLIAAPLEGQALSQGCTAFVDDNWQPFSDQWRVLRNASTISLNTIEDILNKIQEKVDFELNGTVVDEKNDLFTDKFYIDKKLSVVRKDALYLQKNDLSNDEILKLKWLASFRNPEFYKLQAIRMPVNKTPRLITLFR